MALTGEKMSLEDNMTKLTHQKRYHMQQQDIS